MDIDKLEAGRELVDYVAKDVMGWEKRIGITEVWVDEMGFVMAEVEKYRPDLDISAAWLVVEKLRERGWYFTIETNEPYDVTFTCNIRDSNKGTWDRDGTYDKWITEDVRADTAPLAICRAALKATETE